MADQEHDIPEMDYAAHNGTYEAFVTATKWSVISIAVVLALMAIFL